MKPLERIFRYFYSTENITSESQLREDFGEFPPKPLRGDGLSGHLNIVSVRGIGENIYTVVMLKRMIEGAADIDYLSPTMRNQLGSILGDFKIFNELTGIRKKVFLWIGLSFIFIASSLNFIRTAPKNSFGFFAPIRRDECEIIIKVRKAAKEGMNAASIISHEHIHLLQNKAHHKKDTSREFICSDDKIFTEKIRVHELLPHIKYVLEKNEVEARLHELVVSFYRAHKELPMSISGFLGILAGNKELGQLVSEILKKAQLYFDPVLFEFVDRDNIQTRDIHLVLISMPDDVMLKFITEVLPVMYGNLLNYYGDQVASSKFTSQISRPNFYDELYVL